MKLSFPKSAATVLLLAATGINGYLTSKSTSPAWTRNSKSSSTSLPVSIGLGPEKKEDGQDQELVPGVDYEVPDHEKYRLSRRTKLDEQCDAWYGSLLGENNGILGDLAKDARDRLMTPVPLENDVQAPVENTEEWTPYVTTKLPWTPLMPAFGLEQYGLPVPRRNAETWRHFDVAGMVEQDYSTTPPGVGSDLNLSEDEVAAYKAKLREKGGWLEDEACTARLVYIDGQFVPQLSISNDIAQNLDKLDSVSEEAKGYLARLTDGFTDELAAPVPVNDQGDTWSSYKWLSGPDHKIGEPTSQFAINTQQGTACFAALNTIKTGAVAYVHASASQNKESENPKPVLIVNAVSTNGSANKDLEEGKGVAQHPRTLVVANEGSRLAVVQSMVDLDTDDKPVPKLYNGYTQFFVKGEANVTHSYLDESGGIVTPNVEVDDDDAEEGKPKPREIEAERPSLKDTHLEAIDVHLMGEKARYQGTMMGVGASGRVRIAMSVTLLKPGTDATVNGFSLAGGAQKADMKTNIHHIADGCTSHQIQKNMIGGRATSAFRGRIRVEQSAQQTDSEQLSRTILLSDRARAWAVPSLEIIADDVQCAHGATVSDLSEEELFYLRSRGLSRAVARNLLMYAFAGDVSACVDPSMLAEVDSNVGLQKRVIQRLENLVPAGERALKGEYSSI